MIRRLLLGAIAMLPALLFPTATAGASGLGARAQCSAAYTAVDSSAASQPMPGKCAALARSMAGL